MTTIYYGVMNKIHALLEAVRLTMQAGASVCRRKFFF